MLNEKEMLFVVDEENRPVEPRSRKEVHERGYWHRNSHIWVKNSRGQILCQQRSFKKDMYPGLWEPFFGGHLLTGEDYAFNAVKECNEELGFNLKKEDLKFFKVFKVDHQKEFVAVYALCWDGDVKKINFEKDEIVQIKWFDLGELRRILCVEENSTWSTIGYKKISYNEEVLDWLSTLD
jgi:isopentenyldiphosphate isomerase